MKNNLFQAKLMEEIQKKIPQKSKLVNTLTLILNIEKEAVYRRLRGEVPFTFSEIATISRELSFSVDELIDGTREDISSFKLKHVEFADPSDKDFALMEQLSQFLSFIDHPGTECGEATNSIPQDFFIGYNNIIKLYLFKWNYLYNELGKPTPYKDVVFNDRLLEYHDVYRTSVRKIGHSKYILDNDLFYYLCKDINYFRGVNLINEEEVEIIKQDLLNILKDMEELSITGQYKQTGNKVQIYISNLNLNTSYKYYQTVTYHLSFIKAFTVNAVVAFDKKTLEIVKKWMQSLIKSSTLITESGEIERIRFFQTQRKIIESL